MKCCIWTVLAMTAVLTGGCAHQSKHGGAPSDRAHSAPDGWAVRVCKPNTEVGRIRLFIGLGGASGTHRPWTEWVSSDSEWVAVPDEFRHVREIWVRGEGIPNGRNVHMGTYYNGRCTQKMTFDNGEEHETSQGDSDDFGC